MDATLQALKEWGPAGVALGLVLLALKDVLLEIVRQAFKRRESDASGAVDLAKSLDKLAGVAGGLADLARSLDKMAAVLERMEKFQERTLDSILENQRRMMELLTNVSFRVEHLAEDSGRLEALLVALTKRWRVVGGHSTGDEENAQ